MEFQKCYSEETGGGMYVLGDLTQLGGVIEFLQCATGSNISLYAGRGYAERPVVGGGALHIVRGNLIQKAGSISVDSCTTEGSGGGIFILNGDFQQTEVQICRTAPQKCWQGASACRMEVSCKRMACCGLVTAMPARRVVPAASKKAMSNRLGLARFSSTPAPRKASEVAFVPSPGAQ